MATPGKNGPAIITGAAIVAAALTWVIGIGLLGREGSPGFFGPGPLIADVNLFLEVLLVVGLAYGYVLAQRGNIEAHQVNQTIWVVLNIGLIALIMAGSMQDVKPSNFSDFARWRIGVTWLHALVGTLSALAGVWIVLQMNNFLPQHWHVRWWRNLMRAALAGYGLTALLGFATYYFWYVA
jgi:hypothetical protein